MALTGGAGIAVGWGLSCFNYRTLWVAFVTPGGSGRAAKVRGRCYSEVLGTLMP
jgi:hypothetical protein